MEQTVTTAALGPDVIMCPLTSEHTLCWGARESCC
jgi:hypothetical protein